MEFYQKINQLLSIKFGYILFQVYFKLLKPLNIHVYHLVHGSLFRYEDTK